MYLDSAHFIHLLNVSGVSLPVVIGGSVGGIVVFTAIVIILVLVVRARRTENGSRNSNETAISLK